jgi:hypothetical protein
LDFEHHWHSNKDYFGRRSSNNLDKRCQVHRLRTMELVRQLLVSLSMDHYLKRLG